MGSFFSTQSDEDVAKAAYGYVPKHNIIMSESQIEEAVAYLAEIINDDYDESENLVLVCVLKGAVQFMTDLSRQIEVPHEHRYITAQSYLGTESTGEVAVAYNEPLNVAGKDVIIVDDIIDTGLTLKTLVEKIKSEENPASVKCCTLLDKPSRRRHNIEADYVGKSIDDVFVFGYGLDVNENYRHLPYIAVMADSSSEESTSSDE